jgi:hypothetical protein
VKEKYRHAERKSEEFNLRMYEMEKEVRSMLQEREREIKDT